MSQIKSFIKFNLTAGNLHDLHSPFMYNFAHKCLYDRQIYPEYQQLKNYHKSLLKNTQKLKITDFGAGSKVFSSNERAINQMAKIAGSNYSDMKRLFRIIRYFKPGNILELGTSLGKATYTMALAHPQARITSIEGDKNLASFSNNFLKKHRIKNVNIIPQKFDDYLAGLNRTSQKLDLIYMDGNHRLKPTLDYFNALQKHIHNDTVIIVDDIYWSEEMKNAWLALKQHKHVRQSVDVYYFGILFFRKEQYKEHFKINLHSFNLF